MSNTNNAEDAALILSGFTAGQVEDVNISMMLVPIREVGNFDIKEPSHDGRQKDGVRFINQSLRSRLDEARLAEIKIQSIALNFTKNNVNYGLIASRLCEGHTGDLLVNRDEGILYKLTLWERFKLFNIKSVVKLEHKLRKKPRRVRKMAHAAI